MSTKYNEITGKETLINSDDGAFSTDDSTDDTPKSEFDIKFDEYCSEWQHLERNDKIKAFLFFSKEFSKQFLPVAFIFIIYIMINISNILFVSRDDSPEGKILLNGVGLGLNLFNMIAVTVSLGISSALDTFCPHAFGAKQYRLMGCYLNRARFILTCAYVPVFFLLFFIDYILIAIGQDEAVSIVAGKFCKGLLPGLIFFYYSDAQRRFLQAQTIIIWPVLCIIITSVLHPVWIFLLTKVGDTGAFGNGLSISVTNTFNFILLYFVTRFKAKEETLVNFFVKETFMDIKEFFNIALPSMFMVCLEGWNYQIITILSGYIEDQDQRNSHILLLNISSVIYMFPFALSVTASNIVGKYIGKHQPQSADVVCKMIIVYTSIVSFILFVLLQCFRTLIPYIFTADENLASIMKILLIYYTFYEIFDFMTTSYAGMFRGLGLQKIIAVANLICFYVISIPLNILLTFPAELGIYGTWISYLVVIVMLVSVYTVIYFFKVDFDEICHITNRRLSVAQSIIDEQENSRKSSMASHGKDF